MPSIYDGSTDRRIVIKGMLPSLSFASAEGRGVHLPDRIISDAFVADTHGSEENDVLPSRNAELARDVRGVARQAALHEEHYATEKDGAGLLSGAIRKKYPRSESYSF